MLEGGPLADCRICGRPPLAPPAVARFSADRGFRPHCGVATPDSDYHCRAMFALGDKGHRQTRSLATFRGVRVFFANCCSWSTFRRPHVRNGLQGAGQRLSAVTGGVFRLPGHAWPRRPVWLAARFDWRVVAFRRDLLLAWSSSVLARGATTALLLGVHLAGVAGRSAVRAVPDRLAGWAMAGRPSRWVCERGVPCGRRPAAGTGLRGGRGRRLAGRCRPGCVRGSRNLLSGMDEQFAPGSRSTRLCAGQTRPGRGRCAVPSMATPYRPTGLSTPAQDDRAPGRRADLAEQHCHSAWGFNRDGVIIARSAEGQGRAAARGSRPVPRISWTPGGGSSDELDAALTKLAAAHAKIAGGA